MNDSFDLSASNKTPSVGTKLEGLLLNSDSDSGINNYIFFFQLENIKCTMI